MLPALERVNLGVVAKFLGTTPSIAVDASIQSAFSLLVDSGRHCIILTENGTEFAGLFDYARYIAFVYDLRVGGDLSWSHIRDSLRRLQVGTLAMSTGPLNQALLMSTTIPLSDALRHLSNIRNVVVPIGRGFCHIDAPAVCGFLHARPELMQSLGHASISKLGLFERMDVISVESDDRALNALMHLVQNQISGAILLDTESWQPITNISLSDASVAKRIGPGILDSSALDLVQARRYGETLTRASLFVVHAEWSLNRVLGAFAATHASHFYELAEDTLAPQGVISATDVVCLLAGKRAIHMQRDIDGVKEAPTRLRPSKIPTAGGVGLYVP